MTDFRVDQLNREALIAPNTTVNVSGLVREALITTGTVGTGTRFAISQLTRETLLQDPVAGGPMVTAIPW